MECAVCHHDFDMLVVPTCDSNHAFCTLCDRDLRLREDVEGGRCTLCHCSIGLDHVRFRNGRILKNGCIMIKIKTILHTKEHNLTIKYMSRASRYTDRMVVKLSEPILGRSTYALDMNGEMYFYSQFDMRSLHICVFLQWEQTLK